MIVVDASVIVKWFIPEVGDFPAKALLAAGDELIAPELARIEVASALIRRRSVGNLPARMSRAR
jgi:predicted nucleic acid-binding protein